MTIDCILNGIVYEDGLGRRMICANVVEALLHLTPCKIIITVLPKRPKSSRGFRKFSIRDYGGRLLWWQRKRKTGYIFPVASDLVRENLLQDKNEMSLFVKIEYANF